MLACCSSMLSSDIRLPNPKPTHDPTSPPHPQRFIFKLTPMVIMIPPIGGFFFIGSVNWINTFHPLPTNLPTLMLHPGHACKFFTWISCIPRPFDSVVQHVSIRMQSALQSRKIWQCKRKKLMHRALVFQVCAIYRSLLSACVLV